jgi:glycosyltransferase involved in cell wall biosynthesis
VRFAIVTYAIEVGGVETVMLALANFLASQGHVVDFVETSQGGAWSSTFQRLGFSVKTIALAPFETRVGHVMRLARTLKAYDVLILNDAPYAQSTLGLLPGRVIAISVLHNAIESMILNARSNSSQLHSVVCVSPGLKKRFLEAATLPPSKVTMIPNGVRVESTWPRRESEFSRSTPLNLFFVGRIEHKQKGVLYLPKIMKILQEQGLKIKLNVVGDGPSLGALKESAAECGVQTYISFLGWRQHDNVLKLMKKHDVLLMPSHYEGHPIALLEAMALGLVPIASRLVGHTDHVVTDAHNGILCEPGDVDAFAAAVRRLDNDRELLRRMSKRAWERIRDDYSCESMGVSYLHLVNEIRQKNKPISRTGELLVEGLGDFLRTPRLLVRPMRKIGKFIKKIRGR